MSKHNLTPLTNKLQELESHGFSAQFAIEGNTLISRESGDYYDSQEVNLLDELRFEGNTDPGDASIIYLLETKDGKLGTLIDAYGVDSNPEINEFVQQLREGYGKGIPAKG